MNYFIEQLPSGRWGIYAQLKLIATIGCHQTAQKILARLQKNSLVLDQHSANPSLRSLKLS